MSTRTKTIRLKKAVAHIHNSNDVEQQYGSVCDADDAWDTAGFILWWIWARSVDSPTANCDDQAFAEKLETSYRCTTRNLTFYKFNLTDSLAGKTLTLAVNAEKTLVWAAIN